MNHSGSVKWTSPSNIALVKYWGKHGRQLPRNGSISLTLSQCVSETSIEYHIDSLQQGLVVDFAFEGKPNAAFGNRIEKYLASVQDLVPWLTSAKLKIQSKNSFPHSSGIASSASAMSAIAMCLVDMKKTIDGSNELDTILASNLARLGSGSASRSVISKLGQWGDCDLEGSSDEYAIAYGHHVDPIFHTYHDDICIVSAEEKSVSSTAGHGLMEKSVFAQARYTQANDRLYALTTAMKTADLDQFIAIVEDEALTLHGLMLCSEPSFVLLEPNTIRIIDAIRAYRQETKIPVCFTLDAGPNIHMLYPHAYANDIAEWRDNVIKPFCHNGRIINDQVGNGPNKLH